MDLSKSTGHDPQRISPVSTLAFTKINVNLLQGALLFCRFWLSPPCNNDLDPASVCICFKRT